MFFCFVHEKKWEMEASNQCEASLNGGAWSGTGEIEYHPCSVRDGERVLSVGLETRHTNEPILEKGLLFGWALLFEGPGSY